MFAADHMDLIEGVLVGHALGVPYEVGSRPLVGSPRMLGAGGYAPGVPRVADPQRWARETAERGAG